VAYLEDPAQLDPAKRAAAIDGLKSPEASHHCREASSRITDPDAFAGAFARGIEHPTVRAALDAQFTPGRFHGRRHYQPATCSGLTGIATAQDGDCSLSRAA
jgi:hypothetical protein